MPLVISWEDRERELASYCGLIHSKRPSHMNGDDALDEFDNVFEIKSTTTNSFCMARSIYLSTIHKWKGSYWIGSAGTVKSGEYTVENLWIAHPDHLCGFFDELESQLVALDSLAAYFRSKVIVSELDSAMNKEVDGFLRRGSFLDQRHLSSKFFKEGSSIPLHSTELAGIEVKKFVNRFPLNKRIIPTPNSDLADTFFTFN